MKPIALYDTTLRDGAQAEGVSFSAGGKIALVRRLDAFGIRYIEGGYAGSNEKDMALFRALRDRPLEQARLVAFGSTRRARARVAADALTAALLEAGTATVTIYGKTWMLHVRDVLRTSAKENLAMIADTIAFLKEHGREVFFDAEHFFDGYRDDPAYAMRCLETARAAGADALVLCDTNGGALPAFVAEATAAAVALKAPVGIHTHNDAGLAVANAVAAVEAGAVQVQGTINGYGERCGNANLCTLAPLLQLKMQRPVVKPAQLAKLRDVSRFVDDIVNLRPDARAPFVGASAFSHKGGPHVNAVRKNPRTFEHIDPAAVGNERRVLLSELSGGTNVLLKAIELGLGHETRSRETTREVLQALKDLESRGYAFEAADASFRILIEKVLKRHRSFFDLEGFRVTVEKRGKDAPCISEATIKVRVNKEREHTVAEGDGPVNALDRALRKALTRFYPAIAQVALKDFRVRILDPEEATAAKTRVLIESSDGADTWGTVGVSENIIEASWEALVDSVEYKLFRDEGKRTRRARQRKPAHG